MRVLTHTKLSWDPEGLKKPSGLSFATNIVSDEEYGALLLVG